MKTDSRVSFEKKRPEVFTSEKERLKGRVIINEKKAYSRFDNMSVNKHGNAYDRKRSNRCSVRDRIKYEV